MIDKINLSEEIDWITVGLYLLLVIFGWMNILASSLQRAVYNGISTSGRITVTSSCGSWFPLL